MHILASLSAFVAPNWDAALVWHHSVQGMSEITKVSYIDADNMMMMQMMMQMRKMSMMKMMIVMIITRMIIVNHDEDYDDDEIYDNYSYACALRVQVLSNSPR